MSAYDPLPFLHRSIDAQQTRSAEMLAQLSGVPVPQWTQHTPPHDDEMEIHDEEELPWLTAEN